MDSSTLNQFATRYTAAWCSQHAASVASFFGEQGSLKINDGVPAIGRTAITNSARSFMTAFPDLVVKMDRLVVSGAKTEYHWTLIGTNTGPGGANCRLADMPSLKLPFATDRLGRESPFNSAAVNCWPQICFEVIGRNGLLHR